jgi:nickel superoxide dismutase
MIIPMPSKAIANSTNPKEVMMFYRLFEQWEKLFGVQRVRAHCDVPCGIYDPSTAQINALTVVRMMDLMAGLEAEGIEYHNSMSRYIAVKEEHAEKAKHEVRVIWGDYIKAQHIEAHPELPELVHQIMQLGSKCRQTADCQVGVQFVEAINQFAQIFWKTKGIAVKRARAPYPPALEMIYPDL